MGQLLGVYGSYVRGDQRFDSDNDLMEEIKHLAPICLI